MSESDERVSGRSESDETMRGRVEESRVKMWVLMYAHRLVLAAGLGVGFFFLLLFGSVVAPTALPQVFEGSSVLWSVFSSMLTAIITAITLVAMFNQLVLSQELGALGDQRERMQGATSFRADTEEWLDSDVSPPTPAAFLAAIVSAAETLADELEATTGRNGNADSRIRQLVEDTRADAHSVRDRLENAEFGTFGVISAALDFNYSLKIYEARRIRAEYDDTLGSDATETLSDLVTVLQFFGPAREHFKTLYFQWELINLSRQILYSAFPALLTSVWMVFYVQPADVTGATLGIDHLVWLVCAAITVVLLPVFLLISYVLRVVTVAKRTLAMGPFVLRDVDQSEPSGDVE